MSVRFINKIIIIFLVVFSDLSGSGFKEVQPGIFVHLGKHEEINNHNKGDICNISFIIGEKSVLVIDSGASSKIAEMVQKEIRKITNLPINHLIITHGHPDHFFGTESFARNNSNISIYGHEKLARSLLINFDYYKTQMKNNTQDPALDTISLILPNKTVEIGKTKIIDIGNRKIVLEAWRSGHTDNDLSVFDTQTKTLITENVFIDRIPPITASILGWKDSLEEILVRDINLIVPGHGDPKDKEKAIEPMLNYFNRIIEDIRKIHKKNLDLELALNTVAQQNIENWLLFNEYHSRNITRSYSELEWE